MFFTRCLDKGYIELVDHMGDDSTVVNAARVSFANESKEFKAGDERLIKYLAEHDHKSPFYHPQLQFKIKAPISVQRQWFKHKIGSAENSESTRYIEVSNEFYIPDYMRAQSKSNKQGSDGPLGSDLVNLFTFDDEPICRNEAAKDIFVDSCQQSFISYGELIELGVAKEQAREILPLGTYTSWVWTCSLYAAIQFVKLRTSDYAQYEIKQYALAVDAIIRSMFPVSVEAFD